MKIRNLFKKIASKKVPLLVLVAAIIAGGFFVSNVFASASVFPASTTTASIDTTSAGGSGTYTAVVSGLAITESQAGDITVGTHVLTLPAGWEFNTGKQVKISPLPTSSTFALEGGWSNITPGSNTITFKVTTASDSPITLTIGDMEVRPNGTTAPMSGNMVHSGATINGVDGSTNFGTFSITPGVPTKVNVEIVPNSSTPAVLGDASLNAGSGIQTVYSVRRDKFNNLVDNYAATWSLTTKAGGVVDGDLVSAGDNKSATFTAHKVGTAVIRAVVAGLSSTDSGLITVHPVAPGNPVYQGFTPSHSGYVNASEESAGFTVRVTGLGGAIAGDTLELLLNGGAFKSKTLDSTDISNDYVDFTISHGDLGIDGSKSLTSKITTNIPVDSKTSVGLLAFTLDTIAPATPVITQIGTTDNYINIANVSAVHVVGTAEAGSTVNVSLTSGLTVTGSGIATGGNYNITINASTLTDGTVTPSVTATDAAGNTSSPAASTPVAFKDVLAPTATAAISPSSGYAKVGTITTATLTAGGAQADLVLGTTCTINGIDVSGSFVNNGLGTYTLTYTVVEGQTDRASGALPVNCILKEPAGNTVLVSSFDANTLIVDANTPSTPVVTSIAGDNRINNAEKLTVHVVGTAEAGSTVNVSLTSGLTVTGSGIATGGNYDIVLDASTLSEGTVTSSVTATDAAGNTSLAATPTALKDTIAPATPVITQIGTTDNYINIANVSAVHVVGTAEAGSTVNVSLTSGLTVTGSGIATGGNYNITINASTLTDGTVTPSVTATDAAGNTSSPAASTPTAIKDTVNPVSPSAISFDAKNGVEVSGHVNTTNTNFIAGAIITVNDAVGGYAELLIDGVPFGTPIKDVSIASGENSVYFDAGLASNSAVQAQVSSGNHVFTVKLCDAANNCVVSSSSASSTADYIIPTFASIVFGTDSYVNAAEASSGVNLTINTTDLENGQIVKCSIEDAGYVNVVEVTGAVSSNKAIIPTGNLTSLDDGTITARCNVSDVAGNPAVEGTQTNIKDVVAPDGYAVVFDQDYANIADQAAISFHFAGTDGAEVGATYHYSIDDANGATAAVTGTGLITSTTQTISGINLSSLDQGTLTLVVTLTDPAGNTGLDATDTIFKDTIVPTVEAGSDQTKDATFSQTAVVSDSGSGIDTATYAWSKNFGPGTINFGSSNSLTTTIAANVDGHYSIKFAVQDIAGNSNSDTFNLYWTNNSLNAIAYSPESGVTGVAIAAGTVSVTFDRSLSSILHSGNIDIIKDSTGASVKNSVSIVSGVLHIGYNGLENGTTYRIIVSKDAVEDANGYMNNNAVSTFTTVASPAPTLSGISANPGKCSAVITFTSNQAGLAKVLYGGTTTYSFATDYRAIVAASGNTITLSGLSCATLYHYKIYAKNSAGTENGTSDINFTTTACSDVTAPVISSVSLNKPAYRVTQDPNVTVTVAEDNTANSVTVNGVSATESPAGTWTATFAHGKTAVGEYSFNVKATDSASNSQNILVTYSVVTDDSPTAPTVTITAPAAGATVSGSASIVATNGTQYQIDGGSWVSTATAWNTALVANGSHTIRAKGGTPTGYSDIITVVVNNHESVAPTVSSWTPGDEATGVRVNIGTGSNQSDIAITFSEAMDVTTLTTGNIQLMSSDESIVPLSAITVDGGDAKIHLIPASSLNYSTNYLVTIAGVKDLAGNTIAGMWSGSFTTMAQPTGSLAIGTAVMSKSDGAADNTYANGWEWVLRITLPTDKNHLALKFTNWVSGANSLPAGGNMQYYSEQIASGTGSSSSPIAITDANTYPENITVANDADSTADGIQTDIHIQVKIPATTVGGAYSAAFAVKGE